MRRGMKKKSWTEKFNFWFDLIERILKGLVFIVVFGLVIWAWPYLDRGRAIPEMIAKVYAF